MVIYLGCLKKKVNNVLIESDWLNALVDRGEHRGYIIQVDQVRFCSHVLGQLSIVFVDGDTDMNHSWLTKKGYTFDWLESYLLFSWTKKYIILKPSSGRER